jgi:iron complex transport system substrate-binding protein
MRIVSLLPSATEILFALGLGPEVVGVSHECDFPAEARSKRVVIHSRIPPDTPPAEIDRVVREYVGRGESLYAVDAETLEALQPDLIVTQDLCHVCAASPDDLATALTRFSHRPRVLTLNPQDLGDVWRDILAVGQETDRVEQSEQLVEEIGARLGVIEEQLTNLRDIERPRVALLEWLQPLYVGGHWVPEMIHVAGAQDVFGKVRTPSFRITEQQLFDARPEILLVAPCGYSAQQAEGEYLSLGLAPEWHDVPALHAGQVYACEANSFFSRPGPRLIDGIEALAKLFHPEIAAPSTHEPAIRKMPAVPASPGTRSASA